MLSLAMVPDMCTWPTCQKKMHTRVGRPRGEAVWLVFQPGQHAKATDCAHAAAASARHGPRALAECSPGRSRANESEERVRVCSGSLLHGAARGHSHQLSAASVMGRRRWGA